MIVDGKTYITEKEIAAHYGRSVKWVRKMRYSEQHFPYYKLNGRVFFNPVEVSEWFKENLKQM